jgi:hypothetical protein
MVDMLTGKDYGHVDDLHSFAITLDAHQGLSLLVDDNAPDKGART